MDKDLISCIKRKFCSPKRAEMFDCSHTYMEEKKSSFWNRRDLGIESLKKDCGREGEVAFGRKLKLSGLWFWKCHLHVAREPERYYVTPHF